jgi:hypothetical protein
MSIDGSKNGEYNKAYENKNQHISQMPRAPLSFLVCASAFADLLRQAFLLPWLFFCLTNSDLIVKRWSQIRFVG